jgi:hypothetical protein
MAMMPFAARGLGLELSLELSLISAEAKLLVGCLELFHARAGVGPAGKLGTCISQERNNPPP